jgi:hypothetical protein
MMTNITVTATITLSVPDEMVPKDMLEISTYANDVLALVMCQTATPDIAIARHLNADVTNVETITC